MTQFGLPTAAITAHDDLAPLSYVQYDAIFRGTEMASTDG